MTATSRTLQAQQLQLGPAWRSILAEQLVLSNCRLAGCEDAALREYISYLLNFHVSGSEESVAASFPVIAGALAINGDAPLVVHLKIMVLGRLDIAEIQSRTKQDEAVITTWTKLFFDIDGFFGATSWLADHVLEVERIAGRRNLASKMAMALRGGADGARLALTLDTDLPLAPAERLMRQELQLALKLDEALKFELASPDDAFQWSKLYLAHQLAEQKLALEKEIFKVRCTELNRRHERQAKRDAAQEQARAAAAHRGADRQQSLRQQIEDRVARSRLAQFTFGAAELGSGPGQPGQPAVIRFQRPSELETNPPAAGAALLRSAPTLGDLESAGLPPSGPGPSDEISPRPRRSA